jgi:hypothetical protein
VIWTACVAAADSPAGHCSKWLYIGIASAAAGVGKASIRTLNLFPACFVYRKRERFHDGGANTQKTLKERAAEKQIAAEPSADARMA